MDKTDRKPGCTWGGGWPDRQQISRTKRVSGVLAEGENKEGRRGKAKVQGEGVVYEGSRRALLRR